MVVAMDLNEITKEYLEELSIHEIRTFAREVGVPHPTSLKKQEMIECIMDIRDGKLEPQKIKKAGRPPKASSTIVVPLQEGGQSATEEMPVIRVVSKKTGAATRPAFENKREASVRDRSFGQSTDGSEQKANEQEQEEKKPLVTFETRYGILEILPDGYGFLRANNFRNSAKDSYIPAQKIKKFGLRAGDYVKASCRSTSEGKPPAVEDVLEVNGKKVEWAFNRPRFDDLTPIFPNERLRLEIPGKRNELAARAIDLIAPIGKGQRAMVVSPPKAGKTTLLKMIANSISQNSPEVTLMVLLIDERPEEVTDMQRSIKGEVIYSTFDEESDNHL